MLGAVSSGGAVEQLLPDRLKALWHALDRKELNAAAFADEQARLLAEHRRTWEQALLLGGHRDLQESVLFEISQYIESPDLVEIRRRCTDAVALLKGEWDATVTPGDRQSIERFYDATETTIYELMWWHTLHDDASPLAYVTALHFARQRGCQRHLDFGAGVGSGAILFARHGFDVTLADISSPLLRFCDHRLTHRGLTAQTIDLKAHGLPNNAFDMITTMDVFEHLPDQVEAIEHLAAALKSGGHLFGRFAAEKDPERPQHITFEFEPMFRRLAALGFVEVWRDEWLWGHQVFQKVP